MENEKQELSIYEKLVKIQNELVAPKTRQCRYDTTNYMYRNCEDIMNGVKPLLLTHECILLLDDEIVQVGNDLFIKSTASLVDKKGERITAMACAKHPEKLMKMGASQITGSTSSYSRKSALNGLFCLDDSQDADVLDRDKKASGIITSAERQKLSGLVKSMNYEHNIVLEYLLCVYGFNNPDEITSDKIKEITEDITKGQIEQKTKEAQDANT